MYEAFSLSAALAVFAFLGGLIMLNELARLNRWFSIGIFIVLPVCLTVFVWNKTAVAGSGAGSWFQWAKTYSALIGCAVAMSIRFIPRLRTNKIAFCLPPFIIALNIAEAVARDFELRGASGLVDGYMTFGGPWNVINGIAGILNLLTICGWTGMFVSKDKRRDIVWPGMMWFWIIAYTIWNMSYVYNSVSDRSMYSGAALLLAALIPAFWIKRGAWAQHRVQTLSLTMIFTMTFPGFFTDPRFIVQSTYSLAAYYSLSILALAANLAVFAFQLYVIISGKKNPLKDDLYSGFRSYKAIVAENDL